MGYFLDPEAADLWEEYVVWENDKPVFTVTEENIRKIEVIPAAVKTPGSWTKDAEYILSMDFDILGFRIPKGYVSDGASVPRLFWSLFPPVGRYLLAAILHDFLLDTQSGWKISNRWFKHTMTLIGVKYWRKSLMMAAVRANGWFKTTFKNEPA